MTDPNIETAIRLYLRMRVGHFASSISKAQINPLIQELMARDLSQFVERAIDKYIKGQIEHGGRLQDRDLDEEIKNETVDTFWYSAAKNWPKHI